MQISSTDNPLFKRLRKLAGSPRSCKVAQRTLIEGFHLIEAALAAKATFQTVVIRAERPSPAVREWVQAVEVASGVRAVSLAPALYDVIAPVDKGVGMLAEIAIVTHSLPSAAAEDAVWLDGIQDPGNVGAIMRAAAAAGVRHVAATSGTASLWSPKVMRAAMGAHFVLRSYEDIDAAQLRPAFGATVLAADAKSGHDLYAEQWGRGPTVWLFGSEGAGLSESSRDITDLRLKIPLAPGVESLNVATAAAVCLFEQVRRRRGLNTKVGRA